MPFRLRVAGAVTGGHTAPGSQSTAGAQTRSDATRRHGGGFRIDGNAEYDSAGETLAAVGDVDGDLVPDILVGASSAGITGEAHLVFGKSDGAPVLLDGTGDGGSRSLARLRATLRAPRSGRSGDVDGDGLADIVIGAFTSFSGGDYSGRAYVVFGKDDTLTVDLSDIVAGVGGFRIDAPTNTLLGSSCSGGGDIDGDGVPDLVVGSATFLNQQERTFVVYRKGDGGALDVDGLSQGIGGFGLYGEHPFDDSGRSLAAQGDVNGDGLADIVVGADNYPDQQGDGRVYVVFGTPTSFPAR